MRAICVGVNEADCHRFDAILLEDAQLRADICFIQWADFLAFGAHPAFDSYGVFQCGKRLGLWPDDPRRKATRHKAARDL